ncbi:MAG: hypothetical protein V1775_07050 [Bacteroidota bacterium]
MTEYKYNLNIDHAIRSRIPGYVLVETDPDNPMHGTNVLMEGIKRFFGGYGQNTHLFDLGSHKIAILTPDFSQKLDCISFKRAGNDFAFLEGTFYDFDLLKRCKNESKQIGEYLAGEIIELVKKGDLDALKDYNGRYSGFVYIAETRTLILITDQYGANRVFVYNNGKQLAVSNNVFALATNPYLSVSVDEKSIAQILQVEYPVYRGTEFAEISFVLPSDIYIRKDNSVSYSKYYQKLNRTRTKSDKQYISDLRDTINGFFENFYRYYDETVGIYLSKGKDCRLFLPFLENNRIPYIPFVFKDGTGVFDYPDVYKIAGLLDKDLHVLENYSVDRKLAFMSAMSTTPTLSWFALGSVATNFTNTALMGVFGDISSGKMPSFRVIGMKTQDDLIDGFFKMVSKGVTPEIFSDSLPYFDKFKTWESYRNLFRDYPKAEILFDNEVYHDVDHRSFRNALTILMRAQHFITPVTPFTDKAVALAYHSLPVSLLKSQKAHTVIAAMEPKSNRIKSTAFPVSLRFESHIRPAMMAVIKLNNLLNNRFLKGQIKKFNPYVPVDNFVPRSDYFKEVFKGSIPVSVGHKRLLTRMYNTDDYLHLVFHDNILPLCKIPVIVHNELEN